jgi:hypothetical protein
MKREGGRNDRKDFLLAGKRYLLISSPPNAYPSMRTRDTSEQPDTVPSLKRGTPPGNRFLKSIYLAWPIDSLLPHHLHCQPS